MKPLTLSSQVLITSNAEETILALEALQKDERLIKVVKEESFLVEDAKFAIEKAYMASEETTVMILAATMFSPIVQNKLLKIIEEPPSNTEFILITPSKSTILDTIRSRLPVTILQNQKQSETFSFDVTQLSLQTVYEFVQAHKRTNAQEMTRIVERLSTAAMQSGKFDLDEKTLQLFSNAFVALDMGSPPSFVLNTLLLKLLARKKKDRQ